ncbi:HAD-superfamily hydrolase, subfamily IA, variant 3 family protein [Asticcacaulis biprosthecium C19]|uniref:HAD-superfamily hydrolase, subfamily IA, variant 3 family protein n=1 Tax=Asticcacaulis biprosthecium C19 TaxID=715226 RepID=F4QPX5_9CAUL|nr:HAD family phosphatase [Asticcacaulis biprosthecium]EGF90262.1 HAD-superfamily hydrolase, subfamily IA, variant 3 family protein [Asticcacaulis biprosthecium C19]
MVKAVLFDIGNVIITWHASNLYNKMVADPVRRAFVLETVVPMSWHAAHDAGVTFAENRKERLLAHPSYAAEIQAFDERFEEMLGDLVPESVATIEDLHQKGVPLYALTNMPVEKSAMVFSKSPVFGYFRDIIISGVEGVIKPDPAIYDITLQRLGLPAADIFFIDDSSVNIDAARNMGFLTHLFQDPKALRPALVAAGIL